MTVNHLSSEQLSSSLSKPTNYVFCTSSVTGECGGLLSQLRWVRFPRGARMPEINIDDSNFELHKQCEIIRPSPEGILDIDNQEIHKPSGYYFDVVWIEADLAKKNNNLQDGLGNIWAVYEVYGSKMMARGRVSFKAVK